jgi:flavin reductase (DIM6/NTAB) family NADH-FMN oxidoreductase RutF/rubredoxin
MDSKVLREITYGVFVVAARLDGKLNAQIANTVFQVTAEPPKVVVSISKTNLTHSYVAGGGAFSVSILSKQTPLDFIVRLGFKSGRDIDKFAGLTRREGVSGVPVVLDHALGYVDAAVEQSVDVGTHTLFIGRVVDADMLTDDEPMTYAHYHLMKGGAHGPLLAEPGMIVPANERDDRYRCEACDFIYDPNIGDPEAGIGPGTGFPALPDEWVCPICGAAKTDFVKER